LDLVRKFRPKVTFLGECLAGSSIPPEWSFWFFLGSITFTLNAILIFYVTIWLKYVRGVDASWEVYCPKAIPASILLAIVSFSSFLFAFWAVWGFMTLIILGLMNMALFMSAHLLPSF